MPHKDGFRPILSIVIPVFNQTDITVRCIKSIRANTKIPYELLWVDNGSNAENVQVIKYHVTRPRMHTKLIRFKNNVGFVKATNAGIKEAEGKYIILLNNDTIVTWEWEKRLLKPLIENKKIGAVGPTTQSIIAWQEADHLNRRWKLKVPIYAHDEDFNKYAKKLYNMYKDQYIDIGKLPLAFFCTAFRKETFEKVGYLNDAYGYGLGEDDEYCMMLRHNGYKNLISLGTFVYHHHRTTFNSLSLCTDSIRRKNVKILKKTQKRLARENSKKELAKALKKPS
jgi:GT2 family glycosyltransferase